MTTTDFTATGRCPYCGQQFERNNLQSVCHTIACNSCGRWFVVKTTMTHTIHRVEGEATKPYPLRAYREVA